MKEEYRGFHPSDRIQMVECNDPYTPRATGYERHHRPYRRRRNIAYEAGQRANAWRMPRRRYYP